MREVGAIDNELHANLFRDYLYNRGMECEVELNARGEWAVWVHDEDRMDEAAGLLAAFKRNPDDPGYAAGADGAEKRRTEREKEDRAFARKNRTRRDLLDTYGIAGIGKATLVLLVASVVVSLLIQFGRNETVVQWLAIAESFNIPGQGHVYYVNLAEVRSGQIWRLITPVFMHFGIIHLIFNMMWLRDLGGMIERIRGTGFILLFVVVAAVFSNIGQYYMSGPHFGGMSGVVYGLLGYVWMQSRFNPWSGFVLHSLTVQMMLIWFVLCLTGLIGNIANTTHAVGLAVGVAWGYLDARRRVP